MIRNVLEIVILWKYLVSAAMLTNCKDFKRNPVVNTIYVHPGIYLGWPTSSLPNLYNLYIFQKLFSINTSGNGWLQPRARLFSRSKDYKMKQETIADNQPFDGLDVLSAPVLGLICKRKWTKSWRLWLIITFDTRCKSKYIHFYGIQQTFFYFSEITL